MARYSEEFKYSILMKLMPPQNQSITQVARETGLSEATLYKWKKQAKAKGIPVTGGEPEAERWSTQDKFHIVVETAMMSEAELAEYCQKKGSTSSKLRLGEMPVCKPTAALRKKLPGCKKSCVNNSR